jgi:tetratricopeptide (TPR) repeat protein
MCKTQTGNIEELTSEASVVEEGSAARVWEESMVIPTYKPYKPEPNPIFYETRITQGAKGNIYPMALTDRLSNERTEEAYKAVHLENEYIRLTVLPEIGGKIYSAVDKTNNYNFIYKNNVIKPALIGLCGPWVSGGIEFNWPQHHRPTTFMEIDHTVEENEDGSKTVWLGEVEPLYRTKGMVGVTIHPGKAYIEAKVRLYNPTPFPQSFLWWANLAVHVNENYKPVFPPDIDYVTFHAKTEVADFPVIKDRFAGIEYGCGTDITEYNNIPAPTSFFIFNSNYNFMGGYDTSRNAGVVHVADNNISAGKKIFTWGVGEFGQRWCQNLTDSDGPYIEIMTGVYTDNQPDFSWLQPYETKTFSQFWYPVKEIGPVKNANIDGAVSLEIVEETLRVGFYTTAAHKSASAAVMVNKQVIYEEKIDISPDKPYMASISVPRDTKEEGVEIVLSSSNKEIISYSHKGKYHSEPPKAIPPAKRPEEIKSNDELYLNGLHVEQYKHPTINPAPYYEESLLRDPGDYRCNNAMGLLCLKSGRFEKAVLYFKKALETLTHRNTNPYDGEVYYNLGLALSFTGRYEEAYKAFYKATWNYAWKTAGYQAASEIECRRGELLQALKHVELALSTNSESLKTRNLKAVILRKLGRLQEAEELCAATSSLDKLDFWSRYELFLIRRLQDRIDEAESVLGEVKKLMRSQGEAYIDLGINYSNAGFYGDALELLNEVAVQQNQKGHVYPMVYYHMGYYSELMGCKEAALNYFKLASNSPGEYCFPSRLEDIAVLKAAQKANPTDSKAFYYLGNLYYDKRQYREAIKNWEKSRDLDSNFATVHRNLALAYFEKKKDIPSAKISMEKAFKLNSKDSRLFFELLQLYKNINMPFAERLELLEKHSHLVEERDDLYIGKIALYTLLGKYDDSIELLKKRNFHPYEGGEGILTKQHITVYLLRGMEFLKEGEYEKAVEDFSEALRFPENYGEGRSYSLPEISVNYHYGLAYEASGNYDKAVEYYEKAALEKSIFREMDYYRGMAMIKLQRQSEARELFEGLIEYAQQELQKEAILGYTTNIPTILPFEPDIQKRNTIDNRYLLGLGYKGLGRMEEAQKEFKKVIELDINHLPVRVQLKGY